MWTLDHRRVIWNMGSSQKDIKGVQEKNAAVIDQDGSCCYDVMLALTSSLKAVLRISRTERN